MTREVELSNDVNDPSVDHLSIMFDKNHIEEPNDEYIPSLDHISTKLDELYQILPPTSHSPEYFASEIIKTASSAILDQFPHFHPIRTYLSRKTIASINNPSLKISSNPLPDLDPTLTTQFISLVKSHIESTYTPINSLSIHSFQINEKKKTLSIQKLRLAHLNNRFNTFQIQIESQIESILSTLPTLYSTHESFKDHHHLFITALSLKLSIIKSELLSTLYESNRGDKKREMDECMNHLENEIKRINSELVVYESFGEFGEFVKLYQDYESKIIELMNDLKKLNDQDK